MTNPQESPRSFPHRLTKSRKAAMDFIRRTAPLALVLVCMSGAFAADQIQSPDGKVTIEFSLRADGAPAYKIEYLENPIVLESKLGFQPDFKDGFTKTKSATNSHQEQWMNNFGERKTVPDNYQELNIDLQHKSGQSMRITFRAYNEGAAFRYSFPDQDTKEFTFTSEQTEFRFPDNTYGYEEHGTEGGYQRSKISNIQPYCERPLTLEYKSGLFASLAEADNENYPRMLLSGLPGVPGALITTLGGASSNTPSDAPGEWPAKLTAGSSTPWRMFVVGERPGDLLERNYLMLNLNPPLALADAAWIKPGKVMRDTALSTANSKAIIDLAATIDLSYVLLDDGWYGREDPETGDATTARKRNLEIQEIISYGKSKNVGLILYVDRRQLKTQRDMLFPLFEKWGVAGVKIGYIGVGSQEETAWVTGTVQKAAEHHLVLDIHDGYRPTGYARTYPDLLTVEGIRGNEHFPTAEHNCTVSFTRYVAGSADYTVCYYDKRIKTTHAHQLAMDIISFSPLQSILWYDKPTAYHGEPEMEFFQHAPTVWDDTKVINGEIGKFATVARRSGDDWFIGTVNNNESRDLKVSLAFLDPDKNYTAHLYFDDDTVQTKTKVGVKTLPVNSQTVLDVPLLPSGGQAVWIALVTSK